MVSKMAKEIICGIYCIENIVNHKKYIGQSINIYKRWREHRYRLNKGIHINKHLQLAWNKYGSNSFTFSIVEICLSNELDNKEIYWISEYNTLDNLYGYNSVDGGNNSSKFRSYSDEEIHEFTSKKLSPSDVLGIIERFQSGDYDANIAKDYNVDITEIGLIRSHRIWKYLTDGLEFEKSNGRNIKQIDRYDLNGNYLDSFSCCGEVQCLLGYKDKTIYKVCRGLIPTAYGYVWRFSGEQFNKYPLPPKIIAVDQYDKCWNYICSYDSMKDASEITNIFRNHIGDVINGKRKTAGGFHWLRHGEKPPIDK